MSEPPRSVRIVSVVPLDDLHVRLDFDDGAERTIDITPLVEGNVYKQIRLSEKYFRTVHIESGSLVWDNGAMLDADLLRYGPPPPPPVPKAKSAGKAKKPIAKLVTKAVAKPLKAKAKPVPKSAAKAPAKKVAKPAKAVKPVKAKVAPKVVAKALAKAKKSAKPAPKAKAKAAAKPVKKTAKPAKKKR